LQTIFFPLELFANHNGTVALDAWVECETFHSERYGSVPWLDVSASYDPATSALTVNLINRDRANAAPVRIEVGPGSLLGPGTLYEVTGEDPKAFNSFDQPGNVRTRGRGIEAEGDEVTVELAPCSFSVLTVKLDG
jgi:alpha-N-arabinofuranosidase